MRTRKTRNISLTPELEALVSRKVYSGRYRSASEVVRAALRLLERDESLEPTYSHDSHVDGLYHGK
jgi:antitoxin ParD1/3/4